jgi:flavin reductase (DIM6/NTAB) family NADH-FMN oxidoreductase RutF
MPASTMDVSAFRRAMGSFPTGVTVVTVAADDGTMHGLEVVALVHRAWLAPLIFHGGTYKSLEHEPLPQVA